MATAHIPVTVTIEREPIKYVKLDLNVTGAMLSTQDDTYAEGIWESGYLDATPARNVITQWAISEFDQLTVRTHNMFGQCAFTTSDQCALYIEYGSGNYNLVIQDPSLLYPPFDEFLQRALTDEGLARIFEVGPGTYPLSYVKFIKEVGFNATFYMILDVHEMIHAFGWPTYQSVTQGSYNDILIQCSGGGKPAPE